MVKHTVFGVERDLDIPVEVFPTPEEIEEMEQAIRMCEHGWFESSFQKAKLHYRKFLPPSGREPKAVVIWMHGISSHSGNAYVCHQHLHQQKSRPLNTGLLAEVFPQANNIALYMFDLYGHGYSEGLRWLIPESWETNKKDYIAFCNLVAKEHPTIPLFLGGESYGGNLTLHVAKHFQEHPSEGPSTFDSVFLTAPAIVGDLPPYPVYFLLRYCLAPLYPKWRPFFMPNPISPERIWRDEEVRKYHTRPRHYEMKLDGGGIPFRLGTAVNLVLALEVVRKDVIPGFKVPFCIL